MSTNKNLTIPSGGIRLAVWLKEWGHTTHGSVVYPIYQTAMFHLEAFPNDELETVQMRKEKYNAPTCRNPETTFGSIKDDCMRRDLTINSLYQNVSIGEVFDIMELREQSTTSEKKTVQPRNKTNKSEMDDRTTISLLSILIWNRLNKERKEKWKILVNSSIAASTLPSSYATTRNTNSTNTGGAR